MLSRALLRGNSRALARHARTGATGPLAALDRFEPRHNGPRPSDVPRMLETIGVASVAELIDKTVPAAIRLGRDLNMGKYSPGLSESDALAELRNIAAKNVVNRSFIGQGYYDTKTPSIEN